jgi:hypothetical protein
LANHRRLTQSITPSTYCRGHNRATHRHPPIPGDLHRRRSVIVQQCEGGQRLGITRIDNDPFALAEQVAGWGDAPQVVLEATYGGVRHEGA